MNMRVAVALCACAVAPLSLAQGYDSFNQSSLARTAVLPALLADAPLPASGQQTTWTLDWSNESYARNNARESLLIDAETQRLAVRHRHALGERWQWSAELPLLFTHGGVLDSLIEGWHSAFGLANGNRGDRPQDAYRIRYVRDGVTLIDLDRGHSGLGDARLGLAYAFSDVLSLQLVAQLPTGSRRHLTGGHAGGALWLRYGRYLSSASRARIELAAGASAAETGGPLQAQQQPVLALGSVSLSVPLFGSLDGLVQLDAHSAPYRGSSLSPLAKDSLQLLFGIRHRWAGGVLDLAIAEDPSVNAAPDFGIHLGLRLTP